MTFKRKDFLEQPSVTVLRHGTQDLILECVLKAYEELNAKHALDVEYVELDIQLRRIEKLFGYEPGTWKP